MKEFLNWAADTPVGFIALMVVSLTLAFLWVMSLLMLLFAESLLVFPFLLSPGVLSGWYLWHGFRNRDRK